MVRSLLLALLIAPTVLPAAPAATQTDSFNFVELARLSNFYPNYRVTCGDADRDGRPELYCLGRFQERDDYVLEFSPDLQYDSVHIGYEFAANWVLTDSDRDGKSDLVVGAIYPPGGKVLLVLESQDSVSLPLVPVWADTLFGYSSQLHASVSDLDGDSAADIALGALLRFYECTGDNRYELKATMPCSTERPLRAGVAPDMDRDGRPEFVIGTYEHTVVIDEAVGDDTFAVTAICSMPVGRSAFTFSVRGTPDTDRDGLAEVIALAVTQDGLGTLAVLEAPQPDSFVISWTADFPAPRYTYHELATGDIDGDSVPEIAVGDGARVRLFRSTGVDQYEQFWEVSTGKTEVGIYDLNCDGKGELIYRYGDGTVICEWLPVGIEELAHLRLSGQLANLQSHVRLGATIRLPEGATATVRDALGRVVGTASGTWNTSGLAPGTYFLRVSSGSESASRKLLLLP